MTLTAGYDIGGAHLKVALVEAGRVVDVRQIVCPLWRGLDHLDAALAEALAFTVPATRQAVTMTGELADVFPDRYTGVARIVERTRAALGGDCRFYMGPHGFGSADDALAHHGDVASANFLASATLAAREQRDGLLIDMGSTTTDIIPFKAGAVIARGLSDCERLRTGELVYTGLTRTPVMAVTTRGLFQGHWQTLARDAFATMADVRRVLGDLPADVDQHATSDGRGKSVEESRARLARCFGRDALPGEDADWSASAAMIAEEQLFSLINGCQQVLRGAGLPDDARVVTAGIGTEVAAGVAAHLGREVVTFGALVTAPPDVALWATRCAPAVAVALLLGEV